MFIMFIMFSVGILLGFICAIANASLINQVHKNAYSESSRRRGVTVIIWIWPALSVILFLVMLIVSGIDRPTDWFIFFFPIALVGPYTWLCNFISEIAQTKGRNRSHYLWFATLLGPLISGILVAIMQDKQGLVLDKSSVQNVDSSDAGTHPCPTCAEPIRLGAKKCRYCGEWLVVSITEDEVRG